MSNLSEMSGLSEVSDMHGVLRLSGVSMSTQNTETEHFMTEYCPFHAGKSTWYLGHSLDFNMKNCAIFFCRVSEGKKDD